MYTPHIQNISMDDLLTEAERTDNEVALRIYELVELNFTHDDDLEQEKEAAFENGKEEGAYDEKSEAQLIISDLLEAIAEIDLEMTHDLKRAIKNAENY